MCNTPQSDIKDVGQNQAVGPRELIGALLDYAERYADQNEEPINGGCREAIRLGQSWFESGSASVDPNMVGIELAHYVAQFADTNDEPEDGDCRRLVARAVEAFSSRESVAHKDVVYPKVIVLCRNAEGEPEFFTCTPAVSHQQMIEGEHYERAKAAAEDNGYEGPFQAFDMTDQAAKQLRQLADWAQPHMPSEAVN